MVFNRGVNKTQNEKQMFYLFNISRYLSNMWMKSLEKKSKWAAPHRVIKSHFVLISFLVYNSKDWLWNKSSNGPKVAKISNFNFETCNYLAINFRSKYFNPNVRGVFWHVCSYQSFPILYFVELHRYTRNRLFLIVKISIGNQIISELSIM